MVRSAVDLVCKYSMIDVIFESGLIYRITHIVMFADEVRNIMKINEAYV